MSQGEQPEPAGGPSKRQWEAIISSFVAIATLGFGVFAWWDARAHPKPDDPPKVVAVLKVDGLPAPAPAVEKKAAEASPDPLETPQPFPTSKGKRLYHYRNAPLDEANSRIERAVIVVPALAAHAPDCFHMMREAAQAEGQAQATLVFVPIFRELPEHLLPDEHLWTHAWDFGALLTDSKPISSFQVLDEIYGKLTDPEKFPSLHSVVLIGHHNGGTFINRYIALGNPVIAPRQGRAQVDDLYVMLSPGSFLYIDGYRPVRKSEDQFHVPKASTCPEFNHYAYGLESRPSYLRHVSDKTIRANLFRRRAVYMVGDKDTGTRGLDETCGALLQGVNRYRRAHFYAQYIRRFPEWRDNVEIREIEGLSVINNHFYTSREVRDVVFGAGKGARAKVARR